MKKWIIFAVMALLSVNLVSAIDMSQGPQTMAQYFSDRNEIFVAVRTDDGFVAELDTALNRILEKLPEELDVPPLSLTDVINIGLLESGTSYAEVRSVLGDYVAFGVSNLEVVMDSNPDNDEKVGFSLVIDIRDRALAEQILLETEGFEWGEPTTQDDFTVYTDSDNDIQVALGDSQVILATLNNTLFNVETPLSESEGFQATVSDLPAAEYNIVGYFDTLSIIETARTQPEFQEAIQGLNIDQLDTQIAFGFTIQDGQAFTIDTVQIVDPALMPTVGQYSNAIFDNIPTSTDALIVANDLTALYDNIIMQLRQLSELTGDTDPTFQIQSIVALAGIQLEEDFLSWTTGDYALLLGSDLGDLVEIIASNELSDLPLNVGLLIEATDVERARGFAEKLSEFLLMATADTSEVIVTSGTISGIETTSIILQLPATDGVVEYELVMGVSDEYFFILDRASLNEIIADDVLSNDTTFIQASNYFLPNATNLGYTSEEGITTMVVGIVGTLALLGPAIDDVFEDVQDQLGDNLSVPQSNRQMVQDDILGDIFLAINTVNDILHSSSTSTSYSDNKIIARLVLQID